jgi:type VI secretion system lysozyme-like protein
MPAPEQRAAAPLFDRLTDSRPNEPAEKEPARALTIHGLIDSVTAEVSRILNSRSHRRGTEGLDSSTVLDYGVPDFAPVVPTAGDERVRLQQEIARRIAASEPRLRGVEVELHYDKKKPLQLGGVITASVQFGKVSEPVSFDLRTVGTTPVITERAVTEEAAAEARARSAGASVI